MVAAIMVFSDPLQWYYSPSWPHIRPSAVVLQYELAKFEKSPNMLSSCSIDTGVTEFDDNGQYFFKRILEYHLYIFESLKI